MRRRLPLMSAMMLALGVLPEPEPVMPRAPRRREDDEAPPEAPAVPFVMPRYEPLVPLSGAALPPPPGRPADPKKKAQRKAQRAARRKGRR